jgi:hypothetical protein
MLPPFDTPDYGIPTMGIRKSCSIADGAAKTWTENLMTIELSDSERLAKHVIEQVFVGVTVRPVDPGGGPVQLHDFEIRWPSGNIDAMEVTESTLDYLQDGKAAHRKHVGYIIEDARLNSQWTVFSTTASRFKTWPKTALAELLRQLERHDKTDFFYATSWEFPEVQRLHRKFGIEFSVSHPTDLGGRILVLPPGDGREWTSNQVTPGKYALQSIEAAARQRDNITKLENARKSRNHLFVVVSVENYLPWKDLDYGDVPRQSPSLPTAVNVVWIAAMGSSGKVLIWKFDAATGWESYEIDRIAGQPSEVS